MSSNNARPLLEVYLSQNLHEIQHRHLLRILSFAGLYLLGACAAITLNLVLGTAWWTIILSFPCYLLAGAALHGISLFTHEGVHGLLSANKNVNRALSIACALPVWQTFTAYRVLHLRHHKNLGAEGDPDHYPNYTQWSPLIWAMHWGRLLCGYPAYILAIPILGFIQGSKQDRLWISLEVFLLFTLSILVILSPIPGSYILHGWLLPMLLINTMVNIRGMSQHTLLEHATDNIQGSRSLLTHPLIAYFMCNENYHLEHHLYPGVPWHNLRRLHLALVPELQQRHAPYTASYSAFVWNFIRVSFARRPIGNVIPSSIQATHLPKS